MKDDEQALATMAQFFLKYAKMYLFFLATFGVAFLVNVALIKPQPPYAGVVEADNEVKSAEQNRTDETAKQASSSFNFPELNDIPKDLIPEPKIYLGSFLYQDSKSLLKGLGITTDPKAIVVQNGLPAKLGVGYWQTLVFEPQKVYINFGGTEFVTTTWAGTIRDLVEEIKKEHDLAISDEDKFQPGLDEKISRSDLLALNITPVSKVKINQKIAIPRQIIIEKDNDLELGKIVVKQAGIEGEKILTYEVTREQTNTGKVVETGRTLINTEVHDSLPRIEVHGTKIIVLDRGKASYYDSEVAAHKTLPFGTKVRVVNLDNGKSAVVTVGDRGPWGEGRVIDLPKKVFAQIGSTNQGVLPRVEVQKYYE